MILPVVVYQGRREIERSIQFRQLRPLVVRIPTEKRTDTQRTQDIEQGPTVLMLSPEASINVRRMQDVYSPNQFPKSSYKTISFL
jgi:hypothetical protein